MKPGFSGQLKKTKICPEKDLLGLIRMAKMSPALFVRQVRQEISRITWATRRETVTATITVLVMTFIAAAFLLFVDWIISGLVQFVLGLGS